MIGRPAVSEFYKVGEYPAELPGAYGALPVALPPQRKRFNGWGFFWAVVCPWLMFSIIFVLASMEVHDTKPEIVYFCVGVSLLVPVLFSIRLYHLKQVQDVDPTEPSWFAFMTVAMVVATALGFALGYLNYRQNMRRYADYMNLASYTDVDPSGMNGGGYLDAGSIVFTNESRIDYSRSIGFKDEIMYCVAPITSGDTKLAAYDFWAVGVDCCSGFPGGFGCFDDGRHLDGQPVHSGRRWMEPEDYQRYFRLAVNQAEAEFGFHSKHPVFFLWEQDPQNVIHEFWWMGFHACVIGIILYLIAQFLVTFLILVRTAKKVNKM